MSELDRLVAAVGQLAAGLSEQLGALAAAVAQLAAQDAKLRERQSANAERAQVFVPDQAFTDVVMVRPRDLVSQLAAGQAFSSMLVTLAPASGSARWTMHGVDPKNTFGLVIGSGGDSFNVRGAANIYNFSLIGEAGQSGSVTFYLFV